MGQKVIGLSGFVFFKLLFQSFHSTQIHPGYGNIIVLLLLLLIIVL